MKVITLALLLLLPAAAFCQQPVWLGNVAKKDTVPAGQAIIYGKFVQRLGFSSGGFPQDISITNNATGEVFMFRVKGAYRSAKENTFCYHLPPGQYTLMAYHWTQSKWYGGTAHVEPIYKGIPSSAIKKMIDEGKLKEGQLERFSFEVKPGTLYYLGTWRFDAELVGFSDEKESFDEHMKETYKKLAFSEAATQLPR
jgi:hypothetical protein